MTQNSTIQPQAKENRKGLPRRSVIDFLSGFARTCAVIPSIPDAPCMALN